MSEEDLPISEVKERYWVTVEQLSIIETIIRGPTMCREVPEHFRLLLENIRTKQGLTRAELVRELKCK